MKTKLKQLAGAVVTVIFAAVSLAVPAAAAKLDSPKNLKVTGKTETSISLSWDKTDGAAKYTVYYSANKKKNYQAYGSTTKTTTTVKGLKEYTKYWFYVRAVDKNGNESGYAKAVNAFTAKKAAEKTKTDNVSKTTGVLKITQEAGTVYNNSNATVKAVGKPNTEYCLSVYYSTQVSKAQGTGKAKSDANGNVSWTWKVGANTREGSHKIEITGGGESIETSFVTKK